MKILFIFSFVGVEEGIVYITTLDKRRVLAFCGCEHERDARVHRREAPLSVFVLQFVPGLG